MATEQNLVFSFSTPELAREFFLYAMSSLDGIVVGHSINGERFDLTKVTINVDEIKTFDALTKIKSILLSHVTNLLNKADELDQQDKPEEAQKLRDEARELASQYASLSIGTADSIPSP